MTPTTDILGALRRLCVNGNVTTPAEIAAEAYVSHRTVLRWLEGAELVGAVSIERGGGRGRETAVRANHDTLEKYARLAEIPGRADAASPGAEYTPLADPEVAKRARALDFYRLGRGPQWLRDLGREIAEGRQ